ncbi:MAG: DNA gyrase subunit A [bacterium]|nr:DNA gyrase subunit A [bacterium]
METIENRILVDIDREMRTAYLDYAMSVIVGRALPDVRDGLKPVHRRILYTMHEMGMEWNRPYKKSARVVGDVMGKYHPHGDAAIYETMVRMAQGFSLRYPLIDGQGNFGSVDGDAPAAMRYTEVRMSKLTQELLRDIGRETVEFGPNYDDSLTEPHCLPARLPNLLVNGSSGIAVGMATNIPPHNLGEVIDALVHLLENPEATVKHLMRFIKGPDFPTAGIITGVEGIRAAYLEGRGIIKVRARAIIERPTSKRAKAAIVVTELPYQVNKAKVVERIAELVRDKKVEGIVDLKDESSREGMRIVVQVRDEDYAEVILNQLYAHTQMEATFGIIMLALVDNQPRVLDLKEICQHFLDHRRAVVVRRAQYELRRAEEKAHVLEGLAKAVERLDEVIALIRAAADPEAARAGLKELLTIDDRQAQAILDLRLQRLTALERDKILADLEETLGLIRDYIRLLKSEKRQRQLIKEELVEVRDAYADPRQTEIVKAVETLSVEDLIVEEDMVVTISHHGYIKRNPASLYRRQRRGGKGVRAASTREEDFVEQLTVASTHATFLFFTTAGRVYWKKVHEIPQASRAAKGKAIVNFLNLQPGEGISAVVPVREFNADRYLAMVTRKGIIKRTALEAYANPRKGGIIACTLDKGDELMAVRMTDGNQDLFLATKKGMCIRFPESDVRAIGRTARGVRAIRLGKGDEVVGAEVVAPGSFILTVTEKGFGKRTVEGGYRAQRRGGKGVIDIKTTRRNGPVVGVRQVSGDDEVMIITSEGIMIRSPVTDFRPIGRNTQGVNLMNIGKGDRVVAVARLEEPEENEGAEEAEGD